MTCAPPTNRSRRPQPPPGRPGAANARHRGPSPLWGPAILLFLFTILAGCAPGARYRTLSFFFDGVPDPNAPPPQVVAPVSSAPTPASTAPGTTLTRQGPLVRHKPYQEFRCGECHGTGSSLGGQLLVKSVADGLCYNCHKDIGKDVPYGHAPVLVNACLQCHEPHLSNGPKLLLMAVPNVCFRCHSPADLSTGEHHRDAASPTDSTCIACHLPHGGPRRHLLRNAGS